jgi:23S rRNA A1618 N6-methylase RlmF
LAIFQVPNRLNYVLWIQDIVLATCGRDESTVVGIDMYVNHFLTFVAVHSRDRARPVRGTGASAIYPLLACTMKPNWRFTATGWDFWSSLVNVASLLFSLDVDEISIQAAQTNINSNNLHDRINLVAATPDSPLLLPLSLDPSQTFVSQFINRSLLTPV